ncbi:hypothetical protein AB1046_13610 [Promicromonospora sp. Populi]|uniref:hypothetical protein n=1 Tax=Promicromonospora sp. Populi TaxID=3239420 RepID=UPI0034E1EC6E
MYAEFAESLQQVLGLGVKGGPERGGVVTYEIGTHPYPVAVVMSFGSSEWNDVAGTIVPPGGYGDHIKAVGRDSTIAYIVSWLGACDDIEFTAPHVSAPSIEIMMAACMALGSRGVKVLGIEDSMVRVEDLTHRTFEVLDSQGVALVRHEGRDYGLADNSVEGLSASVMAVIDATSDESDD